MKHLDSKSSYTIVPDFGAVKVQCLEYVLLLVLEYILLFMRTTKNAKEETKQMRTMHGIVIIFKLDRYLLIKISQTYIAYPKVTILSKKKKRNGKTIESLYYIKKTLDFSHYLTG